MSSNDDRERTAQEALGGDTGAGAHPDPSPQAGARPWHTEVGWDGALTAVVDVNGYLVAECEGPRGSYTLPTEYGAAEANARHIIRAVQVLDAMIRWRAELEEALRYPLSHDDDEPYHEVLRRLDGAGV